MADINNYPSVNNTADILENTKDPDFVNVNEELPVIIKVVGVGGGGCNAINHMFNQKVKGVSFVVCNTDRQALHRSSVPSKLLLGPRTTKGLGAGNLPDIGKAAAEESSQEIASLFGEDTRMVFVTAGMGGGTGTGAAPVVARIAKELGKLTIGIVTIPFFFEGTKKILKALDGADEMKKYVDALMVINNERLTEIYRDYTFLNAFDKADETLTIAAQSISELIMNDDVIINLDFNDVYTTLHDGGVAIISSGYGEGDHRISKALEDALFSPLLKNRDIYGSSHILVNIYFSRKAKNEFKTSEIEEMQTFMSNCTKDVDVIFGVAYDDSLGEKVKVTILASGFNVTLSNDVEIPSQELVQQYKPKETVSDFSDETPITPKTRIEEVYGTIKVQEKEKIRNQNRYKILSPEEMDDDDIITEIEKTPTLNRDPKSMPQKQTTKSGIPTEIKSPSRRPKNSKTINFG